MANTPNRNYPLPDPENKLKDDVLRLISALELVDTDMAALFADLAAKAGILHTHGIGDITGLATALSNKLDVGYQGTLAGLSDVNVAGVANGMTLLRQAGQWIPVLLQINNVASLEAALNNKQPADADLSAIAGLSTTVFGRSLLTVESVAALRTVLTALSYEEQPLSAAQRGQARANIGADLLGSDRNKLINGNFDIWQRGTSQTGQGYGSSDRWKHDNIGSTKTHSRQAFTLGQSDVPGNPRYFARTVVTSSAGASNYANQYQKVEDVRTLAGRKATLTFWAKADAAKNIAVEMIQDFGTGGSPSSSVTGIGAQTVALTTSWQKKSIVIDVPSISGKTLGTTDNSNLVAVFWFDAGVSLNARTGNLGQQSGTFDIARVSLVEGDATAEEDPASPRHIHQELTLCQRYYEKSYELSVVPATASNVGAQFATTSVTHNYQSLGAVSFKASKRAPPSVTLYNTINGLSGQITGDGSNYPGAVACVGVSGFGIVADNISISGPSVYLTAQWTADAEL